MIEWHRLLGLILIDFFTDSSYDVSLEKDLSIKQQMLDVLIIEQKEGPKPKKLPDGLDNLAAHNLMTYKSHQQAMNAWTFNELIGHFVNYRKQASPSFDNLLPIEDFQLYAISTRYPKKLMEKYDFKPISDGVFEIEWGSQIIRLIVLSRIPAKEENAIWQMFSAKPEKVRDGASQYQWQTSNTSSVINDLFQKYNIEGVTMPYTVEDYQRDRALEQARKLPPEDLRKLFSPKDLREVFSPEDLKEGLSLEDFFELFSPNDILKGISKDDLIKFMKDPLSDQLCKPKAPKER